MEGSWQTWRDMAQESSRAAIMLESQGCHRSCASRLYYAAYQSMTALLHYVNLAVPSERQAWSHEATPELIEDHLGAVIKMRDKRQDLSRRLKELYRFRVSADYTSDAPEASVIIKAGRNSRFLVSVAENELPIR